MTRWLTTREATRLALLAACNGALELTLGSFLHATRFPMAGAVMVGLNLVVYTLAWVQVPRRGAILAVGLGTAFLNFSLSGAFKMMALPALVLEAAFLDLLLSRVGLGRSGLVLAGMASSLLSLAWGLATATLVFGLGPVVALERLVQADFAVRLSAWGLLVLLVGARVLVGGLFGLLAWRVLGLVDPALQPAEAPRR